MKDDPLPESNHIARCCSRSNYSEVTGRISGTAFRLRPNESFLSVNWLEFLDANDRKKQLIILRQVLDANQLGLARGAKMAVLNVGEIIEQVYLASGNDRRLKICHEPSKGNESHSGIHNLRQGDDMICDLIANLVREVHNRH